MITPAFPAGTVLQTTSISWELVVLIGIAAVVVIALAWVFLSQSGGSD